MTKPSETAMEIARKLAGWNYSVSYMARVIDHAYADLRAVASRPSRPRMEKVHQTILRRATPGGEMAIREIPKAFDHTCDVCGKTRQQETDSRPPHWANLIIRQDAYDYQGQGGVAMAETIECAAIARPQPGGMEVFSIVRPFRHHDVIKLISAAGKGPVTGTDIQGFVTNTGRFVDRQEGCAIARAAGQIVVKHGPDDTLFSEDMW